jgi:hypothetical protein
LKKAEALKIDALTLKQASDLDWRAKIDSMPFVRIQSFLLPYLTQATVLFADQRSLSEFDGCEISNLVLYKPSSEPRGNLQSVLKQFLARENVVNALREKAFTDATTIVEGELSLEKGSYVLGKNGEKHLVAGLLFSATCKKEMNEATLQKGRYRDVAVVLGSGNSFGHPVDLVVSQTPGELPAFRLRIKKRPEIAS